MDREINNTSDSSAIDFDAAVDRRAGDSLKWNKYKDAHPDVIGAWVADMDFQAPPQVLAAVQERLEGPALGYAHSNDELTALVLQRLQHLYQWQVDPDWLVELPGIVPGLYGAARARGGPGDAIITQSPNYVHFFGAAEFSERRLLRLRNHIVNERWEMDMDHLTELAQQKPTTFLLCNPHNPLGRILSRAELEQLADICLSNDIMLCSDEIHADLLLDKGSSHIPIATLSPAIENQSITLVSPCKAFNLPGFGAFGLAIIPDPTMRESFKKQIHGLTVYPTALAYTAALAAYRDGEEWLSQLLVYLRGNRDYLQQEIADINGLSMTHVEATYLAWINVSALQLKHPFEHFLAHGVALSDGADMGDPSYLRLNFACTRATLEDIMQRMRAAVATPER